MHNAPQGQELPPSSLMSFLHTRADLSGIVLTDHEREYKNPYYHSRFDNQENVNLTALCEVSLTVAKTIFLLGMNGTEDEFGFWADDLTVNCTTIAELYSCFTATYEWAWVRELSLTLRVGGTLPRPTNYVGVYSHRSYNYMASFVYEWIANNTAIYRLQTACNSTDDCGKGETCLTGECIAGISVHTHDAVSPAFAYNHDDGKTYLVDTSPQYPQWTEA